jgi:hypothetical protein
MRDAGRDDAFAAALELLAGGTAWRPRSACPSASRTRAVRRTWNPRLPAADAARRGTLGGHLPFGIDRSHVASVMVAGRWIVRERRDGRTWPRRTRAHARRRARPWQRMAAL